MLWSSSPQALPHHDVKAYRKGIRLNWLRPRSTRSLCAEAAAKLSNQRSARCIAEEAIGAGINHVQPTVPCSFLSVATRVHTSELLPYRVIGAEITSTTSAGMHYACIFLERACTLRVVICATIRMRGLCCRSVHSPDTLPWTRQRRLRTSASMHYTRCLKGRLKQMQRRHRSKQCEHWCRHGARAAGETAALASIAG